MGFLEEGALRWSPSPNRGVISPEPLDASMSFFHKYAGKFFNQPLIAGAYACNQTFETSHYKHSGLGTSILPSLPRI